MSSAGESTRRAAVAIAAVAALLLVGLWSFSPLRDVVDARAFVAWGRRVADAPAAPLVLLGCYVVAGLLMMPFSLMFGATMVVFGPWPGFAYAMAGALVAGSLVFAIARVAGRGLVDAWLATRHATLAEFNDRLAHQGIVAVALTRLTPFPYSLVNALIGVSEIRYRDFVIGTMIGLTPALTLFAIVSTRLDAWLADPNPFEFVALGASVFVAFVAGWAIRRAVMRGRDRPRS